MSDLADWMQSYVLKPSGTANWNRFIRTDDAGAAIPLPAGVSRVEITWTGKSALYVSLPHMQGFQTENVNAVGERRWLRTVSSETEGQLSISILAADAKDISHRLAVVVIPMKSL